MYDLAHCLDPAKLQKDLPPGCRLWWSRALFLNSQPIDQPNYVTILYRSMDNLHVQLADVDDRSRTYELRQIESLGVDDAQYDPVSLFGHAAENDPQGAAIPRLMYNHNSGQWSRVYPNLHTGRQIVTAQQTRDWLTWTGKPLVLKDNPMMPQQEDCMIYVLAFFYVYFLGAIGGLGFHSGWIAVLLIVGGVYLAYRWYKRGRVNLEPIYGEVIQAVNTWVLAHPDPAHKFVAKPRR